MSTLPYIKHPVYSVLPNGEVAHLGDITLKGSSISWKEKGQTTSTDGLPWFLDDACPKGFMGRLFAKTHPELKLPERPDYWSETERLKALLAADALSGSCLVGTEALERYKQPRFLPTIENCESLYSATLTTLLDLTYVSSGVGGEQPKFTSHFKTAEGEQQVIVKFGPDINNPVNAAMAERWSDLLIAEDIANKVMFEHFNIQTALTRTGILNGRRYLESQRFDRTDKGRVTTVSLEAYVMEHGGNLHSWSDTSLEVSDTIHDQLMLLEAFARAIGNTDTHFGNISLQLWANHWQLAPIYDMTPMHFAPTNQGINDKPYVFNWPKNCPEEIKPTVLMAARSFIQQLQLNNDVSENFKELLKPLYEQLRETNYEFNV